MVKGRCLQINSELLEIHIYTRNPLTSLQEGVSNVYQKSYSFSFIILPTFAMNAFNGSMSGRISSSVVTYTQL